VSAAKVTRIAVRELRLVCDLLQNTTKEVLERDKRKAAMILLPKAGIKASQVGGLS
jgi:hypothetical protein